VRLFGVDPTPVVPLPAYSDPAVATLLAGPPKLTPRHLAVLGVWQRSLFSVSPKAIAAELHFEIAEANRLLNDLAARGYLGRAPSR
jgi:hypothetical protein